MNPQGNGSAIHYTVEVSSSIKAEIKELAKRAAAIGQKQAYVDAWLAIEKRLETAPLQFGECHYHLGNGKLRCHIGVVQPVAVEFAIYELKHRVVLLRVAFPPCAFAQGDDADKKTIKRLLPEMDLVPSLYARGEEPVNLKTLPKFSATKLFGYPVAKKETVEAERGFWKASKEIYAKNHPLRAAIFEAMDETEKLKALELAMTIPGRGLTPKDKAAFLLKQAPLAIGIFSLDKINRQMQDATEKRGQEGSNRWKANVDLAHTRTLGNLVFLYEYNYSVGQIRADNLPELGIDDMGWKIAFLPKINVTEPKTRTYSKDLAKLLTKMQEEHTGTPWAYFGERDTKRNMGMAWEPKKK